MKLSQANYLQISLVSFDRFSAADCAIFDVIDSRNRDDQLEPTTQLQTIGFSSRSLTTLCFIVFFFQSNVSFINKSIMNLHVDFFLQFHLICIMYVKRICRVFQVPITKGYFLLNFEQSCHCEKIFIFFHYVLYVK